MIKYWAPLQPSSSIMWAFNHFVYVEWMIGMHQYTILILKYYSFLGSSDKKYSCNFFKYNSFYFNSEITLLMFMKVCFSLFIQAWLKLNQIACNGNQAHFDETFKFHQSGTGNSPSSSVYLHFLLLYKWSYVACCIFMKRSTCTQYLRQCWYLGLKLVLNSFQVWTKVTQ